MKAGVGLGFNIRGRGWPQSPEAAKDKKLGVKMQNLTVITCSGIPQSSKQGVIGPQKLPEIQNWG